ncbi:MAG: tetratricopeptide repeat protein, partial [Rhodothermales bacterium]
VALYLVTVVSKQRVPAEASASAEAPADVRSASVIDSHESLPIDPVFASVVDSLERAAAEAEGEAALEFRRRLSDYFLGIGRVDRAAIEQRRVATSSGTLADWIRAADLFFDWMEATEDEEKTDIALLTIDALKKVLEKDEDSIDARAKLGWAYQFDPSNPMEAIQQTNRALEQDPDHLMANYNRAVFLTRINRLDEAMTQFERVKVLSEEGSLYFRRAEAWLESIRRSRAEDAG